VPAENLMRDGFSIDEAKRKVEALGIRDQISRISIR